MWIYFAIASFVIYIICVILSKKVNRTICKESVRAIVVSTMLYAIYSVIIYFVVIGFIDNNIYYLLLLFPCIIALLDAYSYLLTPIIFYFFSKKSQTNQYDSFLKEAGIDARIFMVTRSNRVCSMRLFGGSRTLFVGEQLLGRMTHEQICAMIYRETVQIRRGHFLWFWLYDYLRFFVMIGIFLSRNIFEDSITSGFVVMIIVIALILVTLYIFRLPRMYIEKRADVMSARYIGKQEYIDTLAALYGAKSEKKYLEFPPLEKRIEYIEKHI